MADFNLHGFDLFGDPIKPKASGIVAEKFTFPPFTILDAKQGEWQERKREWLSIGIKSEIGRGDNLLMGGGVDEFDKYRDIEKNKFGKCNTFTPENMLDAYGRAPMNATSVFDPVVCELMYKWFCPTNGQIIDCFAGGSVRGIVAGALGFKYWGCDLRKEQVEANQIQAKELFPESNIKWECGDSLITMDKSPEADFLFSCPPYGDLEVYSEISEDLSNMEHSDFVIAYKKIIENSVKRLKNDSFACFVVGDFRDKKGFYRNFVSETINAFENAGAKLYNEAILATSVGTACLRVTKQFNAGRKLAKTHQNILVFCKGDPKKASNKIEQC
jgi:DNA modification methylase